MAGNGALKENVDVGRGGALGPLEGSADVDAGSDAIVVVVVESQERKWNARCRQGLSELGQIPAPTRPLSTKLRRGCSRVLLDLAFHFM